MDGYQIAKEQIEKCSNYAEWAHFLVKLRYRYDYEKKYTESIEYLFTGDPGYWDSDWCEGQTDVIVDGILNWDDIPAELFTK